MGLIANIAQIDAKTIVVTEAKTKALGEIWTLDPWFTRPVL